MGKLKVTNLTCEYRKNPLGIDQPNPRISWQLTAPRRGTMQTAYQVQVTGANQDFAAPLWDSGRVCDDQSVHITYAGPPLAPRTRYVYRVKVWDNAEQESEWSDLAFWETGLLTTDAWEAQWITPDPQAIEAQSEPAFLLRKGFSLGKTIATARVYVTALGVYELYINGRRISDALLAPGWTSYKHRVQYQTYDVTSELKEGANGLGMVLGDGWYKSGLGFNEGFFYGDTRAALLQLHVRYQDGTAEVVGTDTTWKATLSPIRYSNIYHGERYDARLEVPGWSEAIFDESEWHPVVTCDLPLTHVVAQENVPTRITETLKPQAFMRTPAGDAVLDMGQNMVGRMRLSVEAPAGTTIRLQHAEVLDNEGNFYTENLRAAKQLVEYTTKGEELETYAPYLTFQGFRYVKVEGYPTQDECDLPLEKFVGEVIHSDMPLVGEFECSHPLINQLQKNIQWGQRGNFLDVPTDCPQRDERLGWTGDAQVFIRTALFNFHGGQFFTKWLRDLQAEQLPDGGVHFVIPDVLGAHSSAAWGDAATICPWTVYLCHGDKRLLAEQYASMKAWVEYIRAQGEDEHLWNTGFHFGDWLALDAKEGSYVGATSRELIATAFFAHSTRLLRDSAVVLGHAADVQTYTELLAKVIAAFRNEFVTPSGRLSSPTQTAHVLVLMFDLVEGDIKERVAAELNQMVVQNQYHLDTGFVGTPYLCLVLSEHGYHDTALRLLLQEDYPSWLYPLSKGATTIWEHWDGIKPDGSFWSADMNSFNHYAYGAIGDWMYRVLAGLDIDERTPGYKRLRLVPRIDGVKITHAKAAHASPYGRVACGWQVTEKTIEVEVVVPANTTAELRLPDVTASVLTESGGPLGEADGVHSYNEADDVVILELGSGSYRFVYPKPVRKLGFGEQTPIAELLEHEPATNILEKHMPGFLQHPFLDRIKGSTLKQISSYPQANLSSEKLDAIVADLAALEA